jgi:hypothetical protein
MSLDFYELLTVCTLSSLTTLGVAVLLKAVFVNDRAETKPEQPTAQPFATGPTNVQAISLQNRIVKEDENRRSSEYTARGAPRLAQISLASFHYLAIVHRRRLLSRATS